MTDDRFLSPFGAQKSFFCDKQLDDRSSIIHTICDNLDKFMQPANKNLFMRRKLKTLKLDFHKFSITKINLKLQIKIQNYISSLKL